MNKSLIGLMLLSPIVLIKKPVSAFICSPSVKSPSLLPTSSSLDEFIKTKEQELQPPSILRSPPDLDKFMKTKEQELQTVSILPSSQGEACLDQFISHNINDHKDSVEHNPVIAIVDGFTKIPKMPIKLGETEVTHGEIVNAIISSHVPDAKILKFDIVDQSEIKQGLLRPCSLDEINRALEKILKKIDNGERVDAVNLSLANGLVLDNIQASLQIKKEARELIEEIINTSNDKSFKIDEMFVLEIIKKLEKISEKGTDVYIAAGNDKRQINQYSFAENVISVGAAKVGESLPFKYSDKSFVNRLDKAIFNIEPVVDESGLVEGWDITGSGKAEIKIPEKSKKFKLNDPNDINNHFLTFVKKAPGKNAEGPIYDPDGTGRPCSNTLKGTSLACPTALSNDINEKVGKEMSGYI